ncbi:16S rRNA (guanine(966)-N(2))-methyltransferase RsmD [Persicimonas caeni]|uniref:16S rRNA (Guanine(966)-N(2))-methyltransferase RsmD n=1 Tax=Persicimonas caeni TaxID=2292766 RepID=A0A4Y6PSN0_PERCE|nr:16S rRNA (guanine(966)-N(2))-methyltransferase RsmD [Persicimonas caeni]QDG51017.1 16S rRNA (guanine(966)-N(2))-methyltransferase RsmD [Persicimonas caeni]QED32238.1 16S rRNA (guanine(966)-N(2))-methyltransferase RsmD [Persicimonas caeni]
MRIIAGRAGGRSLASPETREIRPTPDRVREALFSILGDIHDAVVVDGFSGTGALGCEALSRGAKVCYFIERREEALELIDENLERIDARDQGIVLRGDFTKQLVMIDEDPDLWLLDPPYHKGLGQKALEEMVGAPCVSDQALVVLEQDLGEDVPEVDGFELEDTREYGRTRVSFFRRVVQQ